MSAQVTVTEIPDCDFCRAMFQQTPAAVDGRTIYGAWAYMCDRHWRQMGVGKLGTGYGQKLVLAEAGEQS